MAGLAKQLFIARQEKGCCPFCDKPIDETFKKIYDKKYGDVRICPSHIANLGGK